MCSISVRQNGGILNLNVTLNGQNSNGFIIHNWADNQSDKPWKRLERLTSTQLSYNKLPNGPRNIYYNFQVYMLTDNDIPLYFSGTREYGSSSDDYY